MKAGHMVNFVCDGKPPDFVCTKRERYIERKRERKREREFRSRVQTPLQPPAQRREWEAGGGEGGSV